MQFPSDIDTGDHDVFVMYPVQFKVTTDSNMAQKVNYSKGNEIVLPTPVSGIELSEGGEWEETVGYQRLGGGIFSAGFKEFQNQLGASAQVLNKGNFINDYASMTYQGSNFRTYSFAWDLFPASLKEANDLSSIIKEIRRNTLPGYGSGENSIANIEYPSMWKVFPAAKSKIDLYLKDCVITNFSVNYTPDGILRTFTSGHPLAINIKIDFKELYRADKGDI